MWGAEGFKALYNATKEDKYLIEGEKCIDYLTFTQCIWDPHYVYTAFPFGGYSLDNSDTGTYLDARQADVVRPFIWEKARSLSDFRFSKLGQLLF